MKRRTVNVIACFNSMHPIISDGFIVAIDLNEKDPRKLLCQIVAARYEDGVTINYLSVNAKEHILGPPAIRVCSHNHTINRAKPHHWHGRPVVGRPN